jgi:hypothetical protein
MTDTQKMKTMEDVISDLLDIRRLPLDTDELKVALKAYWDEFFSVAPKMTKRLAKAKAEAIRYQIAFWAVSDYVVLPEANLPSGIRFFLWHDGVITQGLKKSTLNRVLRDEDTFRSLFWDATPLPLVDEDCKEEATITAYEYDRLYCITGRQARRIARLYGVGNADENLRTYDAYKALLLTTGARLAKTRKGAVLASYAADKSDVSGLI